MFYMDILVIIKDIFWGIFMTIFTIVGDCFVQTMHEMPEPDWGTAIFKSFVYVFILGSPFAAASIAEARGKNRLAHFVLGFLLPWVYPVTIFFTMPKASMVEDEKDGLEEEPQHAEGPNAIPESHIKSVKDDDEKLRPQESVEIEINHQYFEKISSDETGKPLGPYNIILSDGRKVEISRIVNALPDLVVVEILEGDNKKMTVRFPYSKIKSCEVISAPFLSASNKHSTTSPDNKTQSFGDPSGADPANVDHFHGELLNPGTIVGNCKIDRILGCGGMGIVYLAHHIVLDIPVAIKVFSGNIFKLKTGTDYSPDRFLREARLAVKLRHPNTVLAMDAGVDKARNLYYMILEYLDGGTIGELITKDGPLSEKNAFNIMLSIAGALDAAYKSDIIHRDIKPDNIMLNSEGVVKLSDLGLGKDIKHKIEKSITAENTALGSPAYISPEQAKDFKNADIRSDIYSLGATLFHIITGEPPFIGDTPVNVVLKVLSDDVPDPRDIKPEISEAMAVLCMKMMDKIPENRFQTPMDLTEALNSIKDKINK